MVDWSFRLMTKRPDQHIFVVAIDDGKVGRHEVIVPPTYFGSIQPHAVHNISKCEMHSS